jgi:hypothetical protein
MRFDPRAGQQALRRRFEIGSAWESRLEQLG